MQTRRNFIGNVATGLGSLATGNVLGANERIRFGVIGVGERGTQLTREALTCSGAECAGFADVYTRRLEDAKKLAPSLATLQGQAQQRRGGERKCRNAHCLIPPRREGRRRI